MNREDIIRMARESCDADKVDAWHNDFWTITREELERFAALVAELERNRLWTQAYWTDYEHALVAAEREACAKVCEDRDLGHGNREDADARRCAKAIRARSDT